MGGHSPLPRCSGPRPCSRDDSAQGRRREEDHAQGRILESVARWCPPGSILPAEETPAPFPAQPCLWQRAERARGSGEAGIAWGRRGRPSFLLRTRAKACWGRRRGEEALAEFQVWAQQPGSAGVAVPHAGPWAGHPVAGQGSHPKSGFRVWRAASSRGQHMSPSV